MRSLKFTPKMTPLLELMVISVNNKLAKNIKVVYSDAVIRSLVCSEQNVSLL